MPTIYDNIEHTIADGLRAMLKDARRADLCVGYFNLRGWGEIAPAVEALCPVAEDSSPPCRLLVGMTQAPQEEVRRHYDAIARGGVAVSADSRAAIAARDAIVADFSRQLTAGLPNNTDQGVLARLRAQIAGGRVQIRVYLKKPLHAKLYLAHRADGIAAQTGILGSSNLTYSGLVKNDELNIDVTDQDAARKLQAWFEERWNDPFCMDIGEDIISAIDESWASGAKPPYHIYIKTAWHLSQEAIDEAGQYILPRELARDMLEHQRMGALLAAQRLNRLGGAIIGDVVGLGKTLLASAIARVFQDDHNSNTLVICPPALIPNWKDHFHKCNLTGEVLSLGQTGQLTDMRRYKLVIIDESHNLRNSDSKRHAQVRDYIRRNDSRVLLLTATPYNKSIADLTGQLLLFNERDDDIGTRPHAYINLLGGADKFAAKHPNTGISTLAAFELSERHCSESGDVAADDWRELMRRFMVRRTRAHIKKHYAEFDEQKKLHFLRFPADESRRYYFPRRHPRHIEFSTAAPGDQYALLYREEVVDIINNLDLPRYGLENFVLDEVDPESKEERLLLGKLTRAGARLRGFARVNLFKRLESSGNAFLLSVRRHIIRNCALLAALRQEKRVFIGAAEASVIDAADAIEEADMDVTSGASEDDAAGAREGAPTLEGFVVSGKSALEAIVEDDNFEWISAAYFDADRLEAALLSDSNRLLRILLDVPQWRHAQDQKLAELRKLCGQKRAKDKILVFSQYKDTIEYLRRHLPDGKSIRIEEVDYVHGGCDKDRLQNAIRHFSPLANEENVPADKQTRILLATDRLSEGVNLQDAHIIVNYDLPWAIIRLVQRAGRVDRIGQQSASIYCYLVLPQDGVENIIKLRKRLQDRLRENSELIGTDEVFFDEKMEGNPRDLFSPKEELLDSDAEDDTDLVSYALDIWREAIKRAPELERKIPAMPNVVYSAKTADSDAAADLGVIAYLQDERGERSLTRLDAGGALLSQSSYRLLQAMACEPDTPAARPAQEHHNLVRQAMRRHLEAGHAAGGQLGGARNPRHVLYSRLSGIIRANPALHAENGELAQAAQQIYDRPLTDIARDKIARQLKLKITDADLTDMILSLHKSERLCLPARGAALSDGAPQIICSLGLVAAGSEG